MSHLPNVLLFGGGMDSAAVFIHLVKNEIPFASLFVDYGQLAAEAEYEAVMKFSNAYKVPVIWEEDFLIKALNGDSLLFGTGTNPYLDGRNTVLMMIAAKYSNTIWMGLDYAEKPLADASPEFLEQSNSYFKKAIFNRSIEFKGPFIHRPKHEVCKEAYEFEPQFFNWAVPCWTPIEGKECGQCKHCLTKKEIIKKCGL